MLFISILLTSFIQEYFASISITLNFDGLLLVLEARIGAFTDFLVVYVAPKHFDSCWAYTN